MDKVKISYLNVIASLFQQMVSIVLGFISRMLFIHVLGVEILGLNNTFESVVGALTLADLGIQRAITFSLYKPFQDNDHKKINEILAIYKWFYRIVSGIIFMGSLISVPFLPYMITGFQFQPIFVFFFMLMIVNSASSYLLAYKRILFYVDQKDYVTKLIDAGSSFVFLVLKISILYVIKSYPVYLLIQIVQTIISNIIVHVLCNKKYTFVRLTSVDNLLFRSIWKDMKDIVFGKIASFVYDSTDNLVISALVSTVMVGLIGNYVLVTSSIKKIINSIVNPFAPIIGRMIAGGNEQEKRISFELCTHFCYLIAMILLVPTFGLIDKFIILWIGEDYLLNISIPLFLVTDLFVFTMQGICCSYIFGEGLFKKERYVDIITAIMNLSISIVLAKIIGVIGVLIGTVISETFMWIGRSYIVYFYSIEDGVKEYLRYWLVNLTRIMTFGIAIMGAYYISGLIILDPLFGDFVLKGILIEIFVGVIYFAFFGFTSINKQLIALIVKGIRRDDK